MASAVAKSLQVFPLFCAKPRFNWKSLDCPFLGKQYLVIVKYSTCSRQPDYDNVCRGTSLRILRNVRPYVTNVRPNYLKVIPQSTRCRLKVNVSPVGLPKFVPFLRHQSNDAFNRDNEGPNKRKVKPVFIAVPNPFKVIRNWMFGFIIRAYFDPEFNFRDFTEGAMQGFSIISKEMAAGKLENIERLVSPKLIPELTEVIENMSLKERTSLATSVDDILYSFPQNITVHYDDKGGRFLYILMKFWSLSSLVPEEDSEGYGMKIGKPPPGVSDEEFDKMGSLISCTYEFLREITPGVEPEWTITHIQHGKLINTEARGFPPP